MGTTASKAVPVRVATRVRLSAGACHVLTLLGLVTAQPRSRATATALGLALDWDLTVGPATEDTAPRLVHSPPHSPQTVTLIFWWPPAFVDSLRSEASRRGWTQDVLIEWLLTQYVSSRAASAVGSVSNPFRGG